MTRVESLHFCSYKLLTSKEGRKRYWKKKIVSQKT